MLAIYYISVISFYLSTKETMGPLLAIIAIFVICAAFTIFSLLSSSERGLGDDYYEMNGKASSENYRDTTVAYSLQVAVTAYFVYWGFAYGLANWIFIASWFAGFGLFALASRRLAYSVKKHNSLIDLISTNGVVKRVLSLILVASFSGLIYAELFFSSGFLAHLMGMVNNGLTYSVCFWLSFICLSGVVVLYVSSGGVKRVLQTDGVQLGLAYIGFSMFSLSISPYVYEMSSHSFWWLYGFQSFLMFVISCAGKMPFFGADKAIPNRSSMSEKFAKASVIILLVALCVPYLFNLSTHGIAFSQIIPGPMSLFHEKYGIWAIMSFGLANIVWQFSDYTAFHRLRLIASGEEVSNPETLIKRNIFLTSISSPITWGMGIALGMLFRVAVNASQSADLSLVGLIDCCILNDQFGTMMQVVGAVGLSIFIASIMMSTVDSTFLVISQMVERDCMQRSISSKSKSIILVIVAAIVIGFSIIQLLLHVDILSKLSFIYSLSLTFSAPVIYALLGWKLSGSKTAIAIIISSAASFASLCMHSSMPELVSMVLPQMVGIVLSFILVPLLNWHGIPKKEED